MRAITYAALAAYWVAAFLWSRRLPDRYPIHFNFSGQPDRWTSGSFEWFLLPVIATVTILLMAGVGRLCSRMPQLWNIPEKRRFLALTPAERAPIISELTGILDVVGLYVVLLFAVLQWIILQSALSGRMENTVLMHVVIWGGLVWLVGYALMKNSRIKRMVIAAAATPSVGRTP